MDFTNSISHFLGHPVVLLYPNIHQLLHEIISMNGSSPCEGHHVVKDLLKLVIVGNCNRCSTAKIMTLARILVTSVKSNLGNILEILQK